mmetsp:Transcript_90235/g.263931  ORF Transcript_90235/g.263931 Transcript_90235/m.263931 type:complete len:212 (+) Transcript_90235:910-1545(+)
MRRTPMIEGREKRKRRTRKRTRTRRRGRTRIERKSETEARAGTRSGRERRTRPRQRTKRRTRIGRTADLQAGLEIEMTRGRRKRAEMTGPATPPWRERRIGREGRRAGDPAVFQRSRRFCGSTLQAPRIRQMARRSERKTRAARRQAETRRRRRIKTATTRKETRRRAADSLLASPVPGPNHPMQSEGPRSSVRRRSSSALRAGGPMESCS